MQACRSKLARWAVVLGGVTLSGAAMRCSPSGALAPALPAPCRPVSGLAGLLRPEGTILLLGEMHGTEQSPAFVADVLCAAARERIAVTLGLEIPPAEQPGMDRYLASGGGAEDRAVLVQGPFWRPALLDGRSSQAVLELVERARALRAAGAAVRILVFAPNLPAPSARDRAMAEILAAAARERPGDLLVAVAGNVHTQLTRGTSFDSTFTPMGYHLARDLARRRIVSLRMAHDGGSAWTCLSAEDDPDRMVCGPHTFGPQPGAAAWSVSLAAAPDGSISGHYGIGAMTASPPVTPPGASD